MAGSIRGAIVTLAGTAPVVLSTDTFPVKKVTLQSTAVINIHTAIAAVDPVLIIPANTPFDILVESANEIVISGANLQVIRWFAYAKDGLN